MPIDLYVSPVDHPQWWIVMSTDGLSFSGPFEWAKTDLPPDDIRLDGLRLPFGEVSLHWRPAYRDEAVAALWQHVGLDGYFE